MADLPRLVRLEARRLSSGTARSTLTWAPTWAAAVALALAAGAWSASWAPHPVFQWVNAFTAYVYLPAYAIAVLAFWRRRRALAAVSSAIVCWHVAVVTPTLMPASQGPSAAESAAAAVKAAREAAPLRVFYANVGKENRNYQGLFEEVRRAAPDVLVLTEFTEAWHNAFNHADLLVDFPNHIHLAKYNPAATGVYSRYPLSHDDRVYQAKRVVVRTRVEYGVGLDIYAIHAPRPVRSPLHKYDEFWSLLRSELQPQVVDGPMLLVGDFNATPYSLIYRSLTAGARLRDCHVLTGRGAATTWPNGTRWMPPIRIDHALVSPSVYCATASEGIGAGSDHKPLILDLVPLLRPARGVAIRSGSVQQAR